ncbi:MAG: fluoride efflux transporter CrcB, partial [Dehalococcoidales bacterium]
MATILLVGAGGFLGAIARYLVSGWAQGVNGDSSFPWGTLAVNLIGCILIGILMGVTENRQWFAPETRSFALVGLLGGFTTFSTFGYETFSLLKDGEVLAGTTNILLQLSLGIGGV